MVRFSKRTIFSDRYSLNFKAAAGKAGKKRTPFASISISVNAGFVPGEKQTVELKWAVLP